MGPCAFFPPGLHPVLDRGKGHKHAVIAPHVPTGGSVGHAIFYDHTHGQVDYPMRIMTAGRGSVGEIDVAMLMTVGTVVSRGGYQEVNRATGASIAKVVQRARVRGVARGEMAT